MANKSVRFQVVEWGFGEELSRAGAIAQGQEADAVFRWKTGMFGLPQSAVGLWLDGLLHGVYFWNKQIRTKKDRYLSGPGPETVLTDQNSHKQNNSGSLRTIVKFAKVERPHFAQTVQTLLVNPWKLSPF